MTNPITVGQLYPGKLSPVGVRQKTDATPATNANGSTFEDLLQSNLLRFSHHAEMRLQQRGIHLQPEQLSKLESAIDKAAAKGAKESLVVMSDMALIVNIQNRTVVTAMDNASMKDNIFTQIDSAIVLS
ncbi:flagellar biosynthesis protein [Paenibacillus selenitireducens]|uniref:Flagellar biosynthesis protein n=1 Tax=Paenibacillus selenitireducens TaxID=1324314 RepID=A0A1T2XCP4_9BACL|nr:TIGR02530 family flagellar biosynthesis protein [Paenibacillus selenitireducens]OPA77598.1 flagellar biosynthesis protein [Paenibacillus selenitireducens]